MSFAFLKRGARQSAAQRRAAARYETSSLPAFNFGVVMDVSTTGMRVRRPGKPIVLPGAVERFVIVAGSGPISLQGKIAWVKGPSLFSKNHEYGVQFLHVDPGTRDRLEHVGQYGFDNGPAPENPTERARRKVLASIEVEDLYPILGVAPTASQDELGTAYRTLVRRWHPDVCQEPGAADELTRVSKAYRVLRDPDLRAKYDQMRASAKAVVPPVSAARPAA